MDNKGKKKYLGNYILWFDCDYISGGPIYSCNKAKYMDELGWNVIVIPTNSDNVKFLDIKQFVVPWFKHSLHMPFVFLEHRANLFIDNLIKSLPLIQGETVIETGTYFTALWGELLASRLRAKHLIVFLDEFDFFSRHNKNLMPFFYFKYSRRELACISTKTMHHIFGSYFNISESQCIELPCCCSNSVQDYPHPFAALLEKSDFNIGYIGRIEKDFFLSIVHSIKEFASDNPDKCLTFMVLGSGPGDSEIKLAHDLATVPNIKLFISGYIFPIPVCCVKHCELFISGAGSASVSSKLGIPTICVNNYGSEPLGFISVNSVHPFQKIPNAPGIIDYIRYFYGQGSFSAPQAIDLAKEWEDIKIKFNSHIQFMDNSEKSPAYFNVFSIPLSVKQHLHRFLYLLVGEYAYKLKIRSLLSWRSKNSVSAK